MFGDDPLIVDNQGTARILLILEDVGEQFSLFSRDLIKFLRLAPLGESAKESDENDTSKLDKLRNDSKSGKSGLPGRFSGIGVTVDLTGRDYSSKGQELSRSQVIEDYSDPNRARKAEVP